MTKRTPIVCTLTARELEARADQWRKLIRRSNPYVTIVDRGVTVRFPDARIRTEVEALAAQERRCCSWMNLDVRDEGHELILTISSDSAEGAAAIRNLLIARPEH